MSTVLDFFKKLLDPTDWPPRWHCGQWTAFHGWLYIISDLLIWGAYFTIPVVIIRYITYNKHQRFIRLYFLFAAFILACGATHLLDAITFWVLLYRLSALMRAITAIVSWLTVFNLIRLLPFAFSLKPPALLEAEIEMRKKAEADLLLKNNELEESRKTFKSAFEYSSIGIAIVSPEGRWLDVNRALCTMVGYTKEEMLGLTFQEITHPGDLARDLAFVNQLLNKEKDTYQMEKRYFTKDGSVVWALLSVSLVWQNDAPAFFISQIVDITAKRLLVSEVEKMNHELLKANEELRHNITTTNEFNRIIGHNLRGPASSLINMAEFLENNPNQEDRIFLLSKLKGTSAMIIQTLNDLRDFLEIQLKHETQDEPSSFEESLQNCSQLLAGLIKLTGAIIQVEFYVQQVEFPSVYLDSVLYNLLSNALKYRRADVAPVIHIKTTMQDDGIVLQVSDNGIGIDLQKQGSEIFKYKRVFHKGYESNGVGLFLVKTQVEAFRGNIHVKSTVNKGTEFRILFPFK